jgi:hypothetical protein
VKAPIAPLKVDEEQKAKLIEEGGQLTADESKCLCGGVSCCFRRVGSEEGKKGRAAGCEDGKDTS